MLIEYFTATPRAMLNTNINSYKHFSIANNV